MLAFEVLNTHTHTCMYVHVRAHTRAYTQFSLWLATSWESEGKKKLASVPNSSRLS